MKNIFSIIFLLLITSLFAQNAFKATLINKKIKEIIAGVALFIEQLNWTEISNEKGEVFFKCS